MHFIVESTIDPLVEATRKMEQEAALFQKKADRFSRHYARHPITPELRAEGDLWNTLFESFLRDELQQRRELEKIPKNWLLKNHLTKRYAFLIRRTQYDLNQIILPPQKVVRRTCRIRKNKILYVQRLLSDIFRLFLLYGYDPGDSIYQDLVLLCITAPLLISKKERIHCDKEADSEILLLSAGLGDISKPFDHRIPTAAAALACALMAGPHAQIHRLILQYTELNLRKLYFLQLKRGHVPEV